MRVGVFLYNKPHVARAEDLYRLSLLRRRPFEPTARLPEPIRADPTLGIILSQLAFVNSFDTVIEGYSDRLYFGLDLADTSGVISEAPTTACTSASATSSIRRCRRGTCGSRFHPPPTR